MHRVIERLIRKKIGRDAQLPEEYTPFLESLSDIVEAYEEERRLNQRTFTISSNELSIANEKLSTRKEELELAYQQISAAQYDLEQLSIELEQKIIDLNQKNEALQASEEELKQNTEEISSINDILFSSQEKLKIENNKVSDSINYALRIQQSMLAPITNINPFVEDAFILLKPKDIVSGDFYWITEKNDICYFAVADCTGHGVPGALMSMIGINMLEVIVNVKNIHSPADILKELDLEVQKTLSQNTLEENRLDGMDIALCAINNKTETITFSGAKSPLLHLSSKGQFTIIKGTNKSIAGQRKNDISIENVYEEHIVPYKKDDCFYMFSDGYQDQFGGYKNKKLMRKNFYKLIEKAQKTPISKQKNYFEMFLKNWINNSEDNSQIDDIILTGFKM